MKKLAAVCLVLMVLGISAQANGYVLVYNLFGVVQGVDTAASERAVKIVNGFAVVSINETDGTVDGSNLVLYGREGWRNRLYKLHADAVNLATYGNFTTMIIEAGNGNTIVLTGRIRARNIGLAGMEAASPMLSGVMTLQWGQLFDLNESLVGSGEMAATLNNFMTRSANAAATDVDAVADSIIMSLEARGYSILDQDEGPPPVVAIVRATAN
jgi:hypothetical protein